MVNIMMMDLGLGLVFLIGCLAITLLVASAVEDMNKLEKLSNR